MLEGCCPGPHWCGRGLGRLEDHRGTSDDRKFRRRNWVTGCPAGVCSHFLRGIAGMRPSCGYCCRARPRYKRRPLTETRVKKKSWGVQSRPRESKPCVVTKLTMRRSVALCVGMLALKGASTAIVMPGMAQLEQEKVAARRARAIPGEFVPRRFPAASHPSSIVFDYYDGQRQGSYADQCCPA